MRRIVALLLVLALGVRAENALPPLKDGMRVLIIGDSVTAGSVAPHGFTSLLRQGWQEQRPDVKVGFSAIGCWACPSDELRKLVPRILGGKDKPDIVFIYFGLNDANHRAKHEDYARNLRFAVEQFRTNHIASAICTPTVWRWMGKTRDYAETARNTAKELDVPMVDLFAAFDAYLHDVRKVAPTNDVSLDGLSSLVDPTADGVHLGAIGNRLVAVEIMKHLGLKPEWKKFPVTVVLANPDRNMGYGPRGKAALSVTPKKDYYDPGEKVTISVAPDAGNVFTNWRGSLESTNSTVEFTVTGPAFIQAVVVPPGGGKR